VQQTPRTPIKTPPATPPSLASPQPERKQADIEIEVCLLTFFFGGVEDKVHSERMFALLQAYGHRAFYRSIIASVTADIRSSAIESLRAGLSQAVRLDIFSLDDLAFNITTYCLNPLEARRLTATEIDQMASDEKNCPG